MTEKSPAELLCTEPESPVLHSFSTAKRPRIMCTYETEAGSMGIGVITHKVVNTVPQLVSGKKHAVIVLDYTLELGGAESEYNHLKMEITEVTG